MEIKKENYNSKIRLFLFLKRILFKKWVLFLLITGIPTGILVSPVIYRIAYKNYDKLPFSKAFIASLKDTLPFQIVQSNFKANVPLNVIKGALQKSEPLILDIKFKNYQKLQEKRNQAMKLGILFRDENDYVSARLTHKDKSYKVKIRLKGDWTDHLTGKKWSFRVKVSDEESLFGMRKFSLQTPKTRNYINEWIFHQLMKYESLPSLRYKFLPLIVNGENYGIYAIEEHFDKVLVESNNFKEGPIIRLSDNILWESNKRNIPETISSAYFKSYPKAFKENYILKNEVLEKQLIKANQLLNGFKYKKLKASQTFDVDSLAKYLAISDLLNANHGLIWSNLPFYYNPVSSKLMPIGFDAVPKRSLLRFMAIEEPRLFNFFKDRYLVEKYVENLERFSSENYLETFFLNIENSYQRNMNILYKSFPALVSNFEDISKNQKIILEKLNPLDPIDAYIEEINIDENKIKILVGNNQIFPIRINGIWNQNKLIFKPKEEIIVEGTRKDNFVEYSNDILIPYLNSESFEILKDKSNKISIDYNILGSKLSKKVLLKQYKRQNPIDALNDYVRKEPNFRNFDFIEEDLKNKVLSFKQGEWEIKESLIIPENYTVLMNPGTTLKLLNNSSILSLSKLNIRGTKILPVRIIGSGNLGNVFVVLNAKNQSILENVRFSNLSSAKEDYWSISGAVTFYESPVVFENCFFEDNNSEDSLNLIRSKFEIINSTFLNAKSDALDIDFSNGLIANLSILNSGNDALDISGSEVILDSIYIKKAEDKGISLGESSLLKAKNIFISGAEIAIASKDLSYLNAENLNLESSTLSYVAFQKKPEYGPGKIKLKNVDIDNISNNYLLENGSSIIVNEEILLPNSKNVEKVLYGNIYGKKSGK